MLIRVNRILVIFFIGVIIISVFGCFQFFFKSRDRHLRFRNTPVESIDNLKRDILLKGEVTAYEKLKTYYLDQDQAPEFAVWALLMANKYNDTGAYYDVFSSLQMINGYYGTDTASNSFSLDLLDKVNRETAIEYLIKASKSGDAQAQEFLGKYYLIGKYVPKDTFLGKSLIRESKAKRHLN